VRGEKRTLLLPFLPQQPTCIGALGTSALGQKRSSRLCAWARTASRYRVRGTRSGPDMRGTDCCSSFGIR
jgi:hypothetical protein